MQIVLTQNVLNVGKKGEVKNVKDGYFQNYLLPRKLAVMATAHEVRRAEDARKHEVVAHERIREQAAEIKAKLDGLKIILKAKSRGDKLYGSITEKELLKAIEEKLNVRLEPEHLLLSEHIKALGIHEIPVRLGGGVDAKFTLEVMKA